MDNYTSVSEKELVQLLKDGDQWALTEIYNRYWKILYAVAMKLLGDVMDAEECVQDLFTKLWANRVDLEIRYTLSSYLSAAIRYRAVDTLGRQYRKEKKMSVYKVDEVSSVSADSSYMEKELIARIEVLVQALPGKCQLVYRLSREEGKTHREIAKELSIAEKTVENHITKALGMLRKNLLTMPASFWLLLANDLGSNSNMALRTKKDDILNVISDDPQHVVYYMMNDSHATASLCGLVSTGPAISASALKCTGT